MKRRLLLPVAFVLAALLPGLNLSPSLAMASSPSAGSDASVDDSEEPAFSLSVGSEVKQNGLVAGSIYVYINCDFWVDNPHYSDGALGVITKVKYSCPSGNTSATLTIDGYLYKYAPGTYGPYSPKASNLNVVRSVSPGSSGAVYVPQSSLPGIACNLSHWYYGTGFATLVYGPSVDSGSASSNTVHPQRCS